jgi:hypothetical protein
MQIHGDLVAQIRATVHSLIVAQTNFASGGDIFDPEKSAECAFGAVFVLRVGATGIMPRSQ